MSQDNCFSIHPSTLADMLLEIRMRAGNSEETEAALGPIATQHYMLALAALDQAQRFATLADYWAARKE